MNFAFDEEFISKHQWLNCLELNEMKGSLFQENLAVLSGKTLCIDADILLRKAVANPLKSLQEGHASMDLTLQSSLIDIIKKFK